MYSQLYATQGVKEYRNTIPYLVNKQDCVLEIGFAWGTTLNLLSKQASKVVGVDTSRVSTEQTKITYANLEVYCMDGFNLNEVRKLGYKFNKIYIDISGCRKLTQVLSIVQKYDAVFKPELIVVKSTKLKRLILKASLFDSKQIQKT